MKKGYGGLGTAKRIAFLYPVPGTPLLIFRKHSGYRGLGTGILLLVIK